MESIEEYRLEHFFFTLVSSLFQFIETEVINRRIAKAIYIKLLSLSFSLRAKEKVFNSIAARHVGTQVCGRRLSRIDYRAHQRDSRCIIGEASSSPLLLPLLEEVASMQTFPQNYRRHSLSVFCIG